MNSSRTENGTHRCVIAFGGNIGNVDACFKTALAALEQAGFRTERMSSVITTAPVDCEAGTPDFRNAVATGFWQGDDPVSLLRLCQKLEVLSGRPGDHARNVSRTLDLDLILFGDIRMNTPELILPHPRAKDRDFVLIPLAEIAPELLEKL